MLILRAAREVVEEEGFDDLLDSVRDRIDAIESLHRTRELTVSALFHPAIRTTLSSSTACSSSTRTREAGPSSGLSSNRTIVHEQGHPVAARSLAPSMTHPNYHTHFLSYRSHARLGISLFDAILVAKCITAFLWMASGGQVVNPNNSMIAVVRLVQR